MHPRLSSSVKWTALPTELVQQIKDIFKDAFKTQLEKTRLHVEGRIYPEELLLRVGILEGGRLRQANFEVSIGFNPTKQNALKEIHFAIDVVASMMDEYFTTESLSDFPLHWQKFEAQGKQAFIQISMINTELEAKANALLGELDEGLVQSSDEAEVQAAKSILGIDDDSEDDDDGEPTRH